MHKQTIGWDVGGAHLKAALLLDGALQQVLQVPCALWRGLPELEKAIDKVIHSLNTLSIDTLHAITMTGELVDLFESRQQGVEAISRLMDAKLQGKKLFYAGGKANFVTIDEVTNHWQTIASANWLASASYMAQALKRSQLNRVLLIDIGSTTTDFIVIENGEPQCLGFTDASRMQSEELVYTGVVRTPLMALTQKIAFKGQSTSLAAEYFATTADVYRLIGDLDESYDMADTADSKEKTLQASARRLARMIGHDVNDEDFDVWKELASTFKQLQLSRLVEVAKLHIMRFQSSVKITIIGAGVGSFLAREVAGQLGLAYEDSSFLFKSLLDITNKDNGQSVGRHASVCLPAYAVASLVLDTDVKHL